jgi:raffinose/stachyose/melibiose transport system permease protein
LSRREHHERDLFGAGLKVFAVLWALVLIYPMLFVLAMSVSPADQVNSLPWWLVPHDWAFDNYSKVFDFFSETVASVPRLLTNSIIVTGTAIVGTMVLAVLASYAFVTMRFPGRTVLFYVILLGLIVPMPVLLIPEFITVQNTGLAGTRWALILPYIAFGLPLPMLILTTFFKALPTEIFESAALDGASRLRTLWSVVLPLARPALGTCVIYLALQFWNEFPLALVLVQDTDLSTVPLGLASAQARGITPWELVAAGMVITSLPVMALFIAFQRQFIEGLMRGSVKG